MSHSSGLSREASDALVVSDPARPLSTGSSSQFQGHDGSFSVFFGCFAPSPPLLSAVQGFSFFMGVALFPDGAGDSLDPPVSLSGDPPGAVE